MGFSQSNTSPGCPPQDTHIHSFVLWRLKTLLPPHHSKCGIWLAQCPELILAPRGRVESQRPTRQTEPRRSAWGNRLAQASSAPQRPRCVRQRRSARGQRGGRGTTRALASRRGRAHWANERRGRARTPPPKTDRCAVRDRPGKGWVTAVRCCLRLASDCGGLGAV